jgi:hypothetical protein
LDFRTKVKTNAFFRECFISDLNDEIHTQVFMAHPYTCLEATKLEKEEQKVIFSHNQKPYFLPHPRPTNTAPHATGHKIQKLTQA